MPWGSVTLRPGVNVETTPTLNQAGYSESRLIRFKDGLAQKMGGWQKFYAFAVGGVPRSLHAWQDLNETDHLAVGTTTILGVITDDDLAQITPQTLTSDFVPDFTTVITSANVTVTDTNISNVTDYDAVEFKTPVSVGGIILSGVYPIDLVLSSTSYRIVAASVATASVSNGGAVPEFDTTSGSATVLVTLADHGLAVGSKIVFPLSTTVGGVTISGTYTVTSLGGTPADEFNIAVSEIASSTTSAFMNSGEAQIRYDIAIGPAAAGTGYGIGTYGSGAYSTGAVGGAQTGDPITAIDWSHDNWGSTLLSCPEGGGVYEWAPDGGFQTAKLVSGAPPFNGGIFVAAPAQILIAWGSTEYHEIGVDRDPLVYAWSDQLDYSFWEAGVVNPATGLFSQAGSNRIPTGSKIVAGLQAPQQALLWTDLDLWALSYIGNPTIGTFGQTKVSSSCGAIGSHAVGQLGNVVMWMGRSNFFVFSGGGVTPLLCSVWDAVFQNLNTTYAWKVRACPNTPFNEMMWEYPSASSTGENDSYVKINITDGSWDYGPINAMARSAWIDQSVLGMPIGASPEGIIYQQETTLDADGQALEWSFTTGYWMIAEGENVAFVDLVIPDFKYGTYSGAADASVQITLYSVMYPGDNNVRTYGPYTVNASTTKVVTRLRGRQMSMKVSGSDLGSFARLGRIRYRWAPAGRFN